jgi:tetratricopeptide (TPR) repeat protein
MSLLSRLFGRKNGDPYAQGIALYEEGRFAEAIEFLRQATGRPFASPTGTLATFHLRQALVGQGRRLLRSGRPAEALPYLEEAAEAWDAFPDLQFLLGAARGLSGQWQAALQASHRALRLNPDYCEARLLEACALVHLDRNREAAASLNKLLEAGRRTDSRLAQELMRQDGYNESNLPLDLPARLEKAAGGEWQDGEVAAAVALCRSGEWLQGIARLRELVLSHPSYPDYRVKLAAALFQVGQAEEALPEVEAALQLNASYRTAIYLKALILADQKHFESARQILRTAAEDTAVRVLRGHEEMFAAHLGAILGLLTGRLAEAEQVLTGWGNLTRSFPRGALLRAAIADLIGRPHITTELLADLVEAWPAETEYRSYLAYHRLRLHELSEVENLLTHWPPAGNGQFDDTPLRLSVLVDLARGSAPSAMPRQTEMSDTSAPGTEATETSEPQLEAASNPAWQFLRCRDLAQQEEWAGCWRIVNDLWEGGFRTEPVALLMADAAVNLAGTDALSADWQPPQVLSGAQLIRNVYLGNRRQKRSEVERDLSLHRSLHPEALCWTWLTPEFWLSPIRYWIA